MEDFKIPQKISEGMKQGLARMYSDTFMREYLVNASAIYNKQALSYLEGGKFTEAQACSARAKAYDLLLSRGKEHFVHFETVARRLKEPLGSMKDKIEEIKL